MPLLQLLSKKSENNVLSAQQIPGDLGLFLYFPVHPQHL